jgi:hypothetical protein
MLTGKRWRFLSIGTSALPVNFVSRFVLIKRWKFCFKTQRYLKQKSPDLPLLLGEREGSGEGHEGVPD